MLKRIFPKQFDNNYQGHTLAIWLFVLAILLKAAQRVIVIADTRETLITADAIPLHSYTAAGAETVVSFAALLAFSGLVIPLQSIVILIGYRAMIPFMYLCLLVMEVGSRLLVQLNPIAEADTQTIAAHAQNGFYVPNSGYYVGLIILAMMIVGFVLSLATPRTKGRTNTT